MRRAQSEPELEAARDLRRRVFVDEQGVSLRADRDGRDGESVHLVAVSDDQVVGTLRLLPDGRTVRLGRMVVEPGLRGGGIGARMLAAADRESATLGAERILLHAQTHARRVYERAGYFARGAEFEEQGIEHVPMEKRIA